MTTPSLRAPLSAFIKAARTVVQKLQLEVGHDGRQRRKSRRRSTCHACSRLPPTITWCAASLLPIHCCIFLRLPAGRSDGPLQGKSSIDQSIYATCSFLSIGHLQNRWLLVEFIPCPNDSDGPTYLPSEGLNSKLIWAALKESVLSNFGDTGWGAVASSLTGQSGRCDESSYNLGLIC